MERWKQRLQQPAQLSNCGSVRAWLKEESGISASCLCRPPSSQVQAESQIDSAQLSGELEENGSFRQGAGSFTLRLRTVI